MIKNIPTKYYDLLNDLGMFNGITDDSREVTAGNLFVAGGGNHLSDTYIYHAIENGAAAIVGPSCLKRNYPVPYIVSPDGLKYKSQLASRFFRNPSERVILIGVTGTCGKTTTTYLLESIFLKAGKKVGVIGTENYRYDGRVFPSSNTTPGTIKLNNLIRMMKDAGCEVVVMEVSSHALAQERIEGLSFDGAIFTNLTHDHLDFHLTMESYYQTKKKLFFEYANATDKTFHAVINKANDFGHRLYCEIEAQCFKNYELKSFCLDSTDASISLSPDLYSIEIKSKDFERTIRSNLIGRFNAENVLGAATLAASLGVDSKYVSAGIMEMSHVPGRMNRIDRSGRTIVVDFAHKPGALLEVITTLKPMTRGELIVVFGCGGARDQEKRPEMGKIAATFANHIIVTSDNQRGENIDSITSQIVSGIKSLRATGFEVVKDRREAIETAMRRSKNGDLILIAGRGSEGQLNIYNSATRKYEDINFSDMTVAQESAQIFISPN